MKRKPLQLKKEKPKGFTVTTVTVRTKGDHHCANDCDYMRPSKCRRKNKADRCGFGESREGPLVQLEKDGTGFNRRSDICLESFDFGEWE